MKYVEEFRRPDQVARVAEALARAVTRPWTVMEICGGQTHTIAQYALEQLLPPDLELCHGPGCPVCVTPLEVLETARLCALRPGVTLCTFGDMLRVPGTRGDLLLARAEGADVRVVLSPLEAVELARQQPDREVVFFAIGFETTAPASAMAIELAARANIENFSTLAAHVRVPPAMEMILSAPGNRVQAFLAAGHVCTVAGTGEYDDIALRHRVPIVVTGFEPLDILLGLLGAVEQLEAGQVRVENRYPRSAFAAGNPRARAAVDAVYRVVDRPFRGLGLVPMGGLALQPEYARFDAATRLGVGVAPLAEPAECQAALVLTGRLRPSQCRAFAQRCTPESPLGAPMVSTEGACAAYYRYRRAAS